MQYFSVDSDYVDVQLYSERLNEVGKIYMDLVGLGIYSQSQSCMANTYRRLCLKWMNINSNFGYTSLNSASILHYLTEVEHIPSSMFRKKGVSGNSIDKNKVLMPLYQNGYAIDFFELYFAYVNCSARNSDTASVFSRNISNKTIQGWNGQVLYEIPFKARQQVNLRFNYSSEDIVGFPREVKSLIQAPEGYILAWGDFAQSDARIAFNTLLKDEYTLPFIEEYPDDIYAGFANLVSHHQHLELKRRAAEAKQFMNAYTEDTGTVADSFNVDIIEKELVDWKPFRGFSSVSERNMYKVDSLRTLYGTRYDPVKSTCHFIRRLAAVFENCPKYKRYWDDISLRASFGVPLKVKCYMGHVEQIAAFDGSRLNSTLFKCLNYPVQGGTSEMMILLVNRLLDAFYSLGYSSDDIRVYYARHDEPIFIMKEHVMRDSWIFKDFAILQVDDWIPLKMEFEFGTSYSVVDSDLMEQYAVSCKLNNDKITKSIPSTKKVVYYPLPKMLRVCTNVTQLGDGKYIVALYDESTNSADVRITCNKQDEVHALSSVCEQFVPQIYKKGFRQLVVENTVGYSLVDESGTVMMTRIYRNFSSSGTLKANIIATSARAKYLNIPVPEIVTNNSDFMSSVKPLGLFVDQELN